MRVIRHGGLNQRPTRQFRPAAAANDLSDQAEHILIGAEPLPKKQGVDAQHTNQGDIAEIQALGNHLGAKQNIILLLGKTGQHFFVGVFLHGRILIHAQDPGKSSASSSSTFWVPKPLYTILPPHSGQSPGTGLTRCPQ